MGKRFNGAKDNMEITGLGICRERRERKPHQNPEDDMTGCAGMAEE